MVAGGISVWQTRDSHLKDEQPGSCSHDDRDQQSFSSMIKFYSLASLAYSGVVPPGADACVDGQRL